jgi:hypothetical protein
MPHLPKVYKTDGKWRFTIANASRRIKVQLHFEGAYSIFGEFVGILSDTKVKVMRENLGTSRAMFWSRCLLKKPNVISYS